MRNDVLEVLNETLQKLKNANVYVLLKDNKTEELNVINKEITQDLMFIHSYFHPIKIGNVLNMRGLKPEEINEEYVFELIYLISASSSYEQIAESKRLLTDGVMFTSMRNFLNLVKQKLGQLGIALIDYIESDHDFCSISQKELINFVQKYPIST